MRPLSCCGCSTGTGAAPGSCASPKGPLPWKAGPSGPVTPDHEGLNVKPKSPPSVVLGKGLKAGTCC